MDPFSPDVLKFANAHGLVSCLEKVYEIAQKYFPGPSGISVQLYPETSPNYYNGIAVVANIDSVPDDIDVVELCHKYLNETKAAIPIELERLISVRWMFQAVLDHKERHDNSRRIK